MVLPVDSVVSGYFEQSVPEVGDVVQVCGVDWKGDWNVEDGFVHQVMSELGAGCIVEGDCYRYAKVAVASFECCLC